MQSFCIFAIILLQLFYLYTGRLFNEYGNLVNWWTPEVDTQFKSKADCMKEQYNSYVVPEAKQNVCLWVKNTNEKHP